MLPLFQSLKFSSSSEPACVLYLLGNIDTGKHKFALVLLRGNYSPIRLEKVYLLQYTLHFSVKHKEISYSTAGVCTWELAPEWSLLNFYNFVNLVGKKPAYSFKLWLTWAICICLLCRPLFCVLWWFLLFTGKYCFLHLCCQIYVQPALPYYSLDVCTNLYF